MVASALVFRLALYACAGEGQGMQADFINGLVAIVAHPVDLIVNSPQCRVYLKQDVMFGADEVERELTIKIIGTIFGR